MIVITELMILLRSAELDLLKMAIMHFYYVFTFSLLLHIRKIVHMTVHNNSFIHCYCDFR